MIKNRFISRIKLSAVMVDVVHAHLNVCLGLFLPITKAAEFAT